MNKYEVLGVVGEGAYGVVLRCRNRESGATVAVKKFKETDDDEIVRKTILREVKMLRALRHPNIVSLREAFRRKGKLYLVFEYMEKNLLEILEESPQGIPFNVARSYIWQLVLAVEFCHASDIVHRDIKPENLLINPPAPGQNGTNAGQLKLCDFGFARAMPKSGMKEEMTDYVATRWYRAPELLLGATDYDKTVDQWAIACILAEMLTGQPLFPGESDIDQLYIIQKALGPLTPTQSDIFFRNPRFAGLKFPDMSNPEGLPARFRRDRNLSSSVAFMESLLKIEPLRRTHGKACTCHTYFEGMEGWGSALPLGTTATALPTAAAPAPAAAAPTPAAAVEVEVEVEIERDSKLVAAPVDKDYAGGADEVQRRLLSDVLFSKVKTLFEKMDADGNGEITREEARAFWGKNFAKVNAQAMFNEVDDDNSGAVDFPEWVGFWENVIKSEYKEEDLIEEIEMIIEGGSWVDFDDNRTT